MRVSWAWAVTSALFTSKVKLLRSIPWSSWKRAEMEGRGLSVRDPLGGASSLMVGKVVSVTRPMVMVLSGSCTRVTSPSRSKRAKTGASEARSWLRKV